jgi:Uma2 family endonuclease
MIHAPAPTTVNVGDAELPPLTPSPHIMGMSLAIPRYTLEDLARFPDDGQRYELVEGMLIVTPSPGMDHEVVIHRLHVALGNFLDPAGAAHIVGRSEIEKGERTHLEPDLLVIPSTIPPATPWKDVRDWWLAVEVFSRSSVIYDREIKAGVYLALGVQEVWLVDPRRGTVEVRRVGDEPHIVSDRLHWIPPRGDRGLAIDLAEIFRDIDRSD